MTEEQYLLVNKALWHYHQSLATQIEHQSSGDNTPLGDVLDTLPDEVSSAFYDYQNKIMGLILALEKQYGETPPGSH